MATILVAGPPSGERSRIFEVLKNDGHTCLLCADGAEANQKLRESLPDLVITDVDLPGLDAFALVRLLEDLSDGGSVPLIVTHLDMNQDEPSAVNQSDPAFSWMGLPANSHDLRKMVRARLSTKPTPVPRGKILVVDDDFELRELLERRLTMDGYQVITAGDGEEALKRLAEYPDLVLTDVDMPRLDGFGLLMRLRAEPRYRDLPAIVMTAQAERAEDVARGLDLGANDYVRKPFDWRELRARVQTQLRVREAHRLALEKQRDLAVIELAGAAAHEINNPLAVLMARLEIMRDRIGPSGTYYEDVVKLNDIVERISEIVKKMSQVRRYQVRHYCGDVNILDLDGASTEGGCTGVG